MEGFQRVSRVLAMRADENRYEKHEFVSGERI
jgi:hypothetical protein